MPINVICSHCESRLTLQDDLLGKQMRCPICREVFKVEAAIPPVVAAPVTQEVAPSNGKPGVSRADAPVPKYQSGSVSDFLPVLPTEPDTSLEEGLPPKEIVWSESTVPPVDSYKPTRSTDQGPLPTSESAPKEVVWSDNLVLPPTHLDEQPAIAQDHRETSPQEEEEHDVIRPRKKRGRFAVLVFLLLVVVGGLSAGGFFLKRYYDAAPERLYAQAKQEYEKKNFEPARKLFGEFAQKYPDDPRASEARFFAELSSLRGSVYSVAVKADPAPAEQQLQKFVTFVEAPEMQPFVAPDRFAVDVWETALKLTEEVANKGNELFNRDKPAESERWLERAVTLGQIVDRFRPNGLDRENVYVQIDGLRQKMADANVRLEFLAEMRQKLADADDSIIIAAKQEAEDHGFVTDAAFTQLIDEAERKIADRVVYKRFEPAIASTHAREPRSVGLLFAPRLDTPTVRPSSLPGPPTVFFALARGVLYALDETDGHVLWATRTGIDNDTLPLLIPGSDLYPELAIVVANNGSQATLTACLARTGETYWHQPLPSACMGEPVHIGQRLFVALHDKPVAKGQRPRRDEIGVVLEIELASGSQIGRISLGRPLGGAAVRRPGTGQIFFSAEARGIYVFDVEKTAEDGTRLPPTFLGILPTNHAAGSLRGEPVITPGDAEAPGYLILGMADGLETMKLRAFPLSPPDKAPGIVGEVPPPIPLVGWSWFPPYCDSEKLAIVTDRGQFGLFGIRQAGNLDAPIFVLPPDPFALPETRKPTRGQVVHADEGTFWFLAHGGLHQLRIGFDAAHGLKLVAHGRPIPLGEPLQNPQVNARHDTALVVTQASASASCRAAAINLQTGEIRWQRQLGLVAQGDPVRIGDNIFMMDHDGGLYQIEAQALLGNIASEWLIEDRWLKAPPLANVVGSGHFALAADGQSVNAIFTTQTERGLRLVYRHLGHSLVEKSVQLPAPLAGNPIIVGRAVVLALTNGMLYRMFLDQDKPLEAGPTWRGERVSAAAVCHLVTLDSDEFVASDGAKTLHRWRWASVEDEFTRRGTLTLSEKIASAPVVIPGNDLMRLVVADIKSNITMWDANKLTSTAQPLQVWRPSGKGPIPVGPLTNGPFLRRDKSLGYVIDGKTLVRLAPADDGKSWKLQGTIRAEGKGVVGHPQLQGNRVLITELGGAFQTFNDATGELLGEVVRLSGRAAPASAALALDASKLLAPISDGTLLLLPTGVKNAEKLPVFLFPLPPIGWPIPLPVMEE